MRKNEGFWAEKLQQLSQSAIETLVRDEKRNGFNAKSVRAHKSEELDLAPDVLEELLELQRRGIDVNLALREFLERRKLELAREKEILSATPAKSRYIPVEIRRHLEREYGRKCSIETCQKPAHVIHHTQRFALTPSHNPKYLAPLCRKHHAIAHAIDAKVQVKRKELG